MADRTIRHPRSLNIRKVIKQAVRSHRQGRLNDAERLYQAVLKERPDQFDALHLLGVLRGHRGRPGSAVELISLALEQRPGSAEAHSNLGFALASLNRFDEAITCYNKALAIKPDHAEALVHRANALATVNRVDEAIASYEKALVLRPNRPDALNNHAAALARLKRYDEALASLDKALAVQPDYVDAHYNRARALFELHRFEEAVRSLDDALRFKPDHVDALTDRGKILHRLKRYNEAIASYEKVSAIRPGSAEAHSNLGLALASLNRDVEAIASFDKALAIKPDYAYAFGLAACRRAHICDWRNHDVVKERVVNDVRAGKPVIMPFELLAISGSPEDQLTCATLFCSSQASQSPPRERVRRHHDRIRLAYLSADFHDHATAHLMAGLFERHDRSTFEITAISFGPDAQSSMRSRLVSSFERFIDVRTKTNKEAAALLRDSGFDIAVDLKGFTTDARGILAHRPAPIQVNYLGYPGTMGADFIDYIVADEFVIPHDHHVHYAEKVVYLPDCYQVNDSKRKISDLTPTRGEVGLPEHGFVFCCFNNSYKITPQMFDVWMRLLQRVDKSVLWLLKGGPSTLDNLQREAAARGVDPSRLVFAPRVKLEGHLSRHRLADLFLDTLPYNAHTTASDALWAGLPVLTCAGRTFAGRVAGSLLHAVGLPDLVTNTLEGYEALALKLATDEVLLRELKEKLDRNRLTKPLFDTDRFRRHIEAAYTTMWEIHQRGEAPRSFAVPPFDRSPSMH